MRRNKTTEQKIGEKIKALRKEKGLSQEELADTIGISRTYVGYIEQGRRSASIKILRKVARVLNVPLSKIFE